MSDRYFLDSNVCLYFFDDDLKKATIAEKLFIPESIVSTQVLAETGNVLIRDFDFSKEDAWKAVNFIRSNTKVITIEPELFDITFKVLIRYKLSFYDSMIVAAALESKCAILYSEDMQHNQVIEKSLTIINPFK